MTIARSAVLVSAAVAAALIFFSALLLYEGSETPQHNSPSAAEVRVLFMGDVMFDRYIRRQAEAHGGYAYTLSGLSELIAGHDIAVLNLEGPVTDYLSTSTGSAVASARNYIFTFDPAALAALRSAAGRATLAADIGNNHIGNFGEEGIAQTQRYLTENHIDFFGSPDAEKEPLFLDTPAGPFALVSYNQFSGREDEASSTLAAVRRAYNSGAFTVLFAHWGEEYATSAPAYVRHLARQFVDAGADMVIGAHPHVIQAPDFYNGAPVYYSLGNAVFDQYWDTWVSCGLALSIVLRQGTLAEIKEVPLFLSPQGITLAGEAAAGACAGLSSML